MRNSTHNRFLNIFVLMLRTKQASHSPYHPFLLTVRILETLKLSLEDSITYLLIGLLKGFSITVNEKKIVFIKRETITKIKHRLRNDRERKGDTQNRNQQ